MAENKFRMGLLKAYQELTVETNNPFTIAGAYALDGKMEGLQAAVIGSPYNYPGEPMTGFTRSCPPGP
eukprot:372610-Heterocapsa_arctica.AAC.1